jgi:hypothetical protein
MWNMRGINAEKKQRYLHWFIGEQRPDIVMFNETKLTSKLFLNGYYSHQTLLQRAGGVYHLHKFQTPQQGESSGYILELVQGADRRGGGPHTQRIPGTRIRRLRGEESIDSHQPCKEHHQVGCRG